MTDRLTLNELQRIKKWHEAHRAEHPMEYRIWEVVLTVWILGWMGWVPALALDQLWALALCPLAMLSPGWYVHWRERAHTAHRLRCDWLGHPQ